MPANAQEDQERTTQALMELSEANLHASGYADEWTQAYAFVDGPAASPSLTPPTEMDEVLELLTILA